MTKALLLVCLSCLGFGAQPLLAQEQIRKEPVLAVAPVYQAGSPVADCSAAIYQVFLQSQQFQVLPDWYVSQVLADANNWQDDWSQAFRHLPQAEQLLLSRIQYQAGEASLVSVWLQKAEPPEVLKVETQLLTADRLQGCEKAARKLVGLIQTERFHSPALSASLSLVVPGAGHFYRETPEGVLLGGVFLAAYLGAAYLGFSNTTHPQITRSQWGGILLLITLADVISAYFLTGLKA